MAPIAEPIAELAHPQSLPIDAHIEQLCEIVQQHKYVILESDTGTGKSRRVALCLWRRLGGRVVQMAPRVNAIANTARIVESDLGEDSAVLSLKTGKHKERESSWNSPLVYCTVGSFLRRALDIGMAAFASADLVILDEVHEHSWERDLLLYLIRLYGGCCQTKFLFMSATNMTADLAEHFGEGVVCQRIPVDAPFSVVDMEPCTEDGSYAQCEELAISKAISIAEDDPDAKIILFVPGVQEIKRVKERIVAAGLSARMLHSKMDPEEQQQCIDDLTTQVTVCTNVAESSLTFARPITDVVDTVHEKIATKDSSVEKLHVVVASTDSAKQRRGRTGRLAPGRYHPMRRPLPRSSYQPQDLPMLCLHIANWGLSLGENHLSTLDAEGSVEELFGSPEAPDCIAAGQYLISQGMLNQDYGITCLGTKVADMGMDLEEAKLLVLLGDYFPFAAAVIAMLRNVQPRERRIRRAHCLVEVCEELEDFLNSGKVDEGEDDGSEQKLKRRAQLKRAEESFRTLMRGHWWPEEFRKPPSSVLEIAITRVWGVTRRHQQWPSWFSDDQTGRMTKIKGSMSDDMSSSGHAVLLFPNEHEGWASAALSVMLVTPLTQPVSSMVKMCSVPSDLKFREFGEVIGEVNPWAAL